MSVRRENPKRTYRALLQRSPAKFLEALSDNIMQGPPCRRAALLQLDLLAANDMYDLLEQFRVNEDESLLQLAAIFHGDVEVMSRLAGACPRLLLLQRQGEYEGQTVLHTLVSKQNVAAASALLQHPSLHEPWVLLNGKAVGPRFHATVMMGELPLSVAALTFNLEMVDELLSRGAKLHAINSQGDTVFHSLVRFAALYPEKEEEVERMLKELHKRLQTPGAAPSPQAEPKAVWMMENKQSLTVLRLAATLAVPSVFKLVLELEGVYCQLDRHDGLFDSLLYDVTEIDPVARRRWRTTNAAANHRHHGITPINAKGIPSPTRQTVLEVGCCPGADTPAPSAVQTSDGGGRSASVLEIICETGRMEKAFEVLNTYVVRSIVKSKWHHYRLWFIAWAVFHVLLMALLTVYAVYKARVIGAAKEAERQTSQPTSSPLQTATPINLNTTLSSAAAPESSSATEKGFVTAVSVLTVPLSVAVVVWEMMRLWRGQPLNLWLIHHNGLYRLELIVFALSLTADSIWYWVAGPDNNFFLILALLIGWWFTSFFLRPLQKFSFFTVMLQKVLLGDMLRFSTIIVLELLSFSVAMYITFVATPGPLPEAFSHLGTTSMTMFKLMLGLTEVEVLYDAAHPWLAITLFVLFVLLTYILMLNALIAMMSNTCSLVSENKVSQWELQRLSVVLLLESMLPCDCLMYNSGRPMHVARFDIRRKQMIQEVRYFTKVTSVQTSYTDGAAILRRKSMMQTQRFDDIHAVMTSVGNVAHLDLLASFTHQQALLGSSEHYFEDVQEDSSDLRPSPFQPPGKDLPAYDIVGKPRPFAPFHKKPELSAIKEQPEGERQLAQIEAKGQGHGSSNYISVRQSLLQALIAAQFAGNMSAQQRQTEARNVRPDQSPHVRQETERSAEDTAGGSSDEAEHPSPLPQRSPRTPKSVHILHAQPDTRMSRSPKPKRKRHNSERVQGQRPEVSALRSDKSKSLEFLPDEGKQSPKQPEELPPLQLPEVRSDEKTSGLTSHTSVMQMLSGRQLTKVQPKLPSPDIFTISHKQPHVDSDA